MLEIRDDGRVEVLMGCPSFHPTDIPVKSEHELILHPLEVQGFDFQITAVSMGNPHCVIFVDELAELPFEEIGSVLERDALFPAGTNVELVEVVRRRKLIVKIWERSVGPTLSCGSGIAAVLAAGVRAGLCEEEVLVEVPGGEVEACLKRESEHEIISVTAPVTTIYEGSFSAEELKAGFRPSIG